MTAEVVELELKRALYERDAARADARRATAQGNAALAFMARKKKAPQPIDWDNSFTVPYGARRPSAPTTMDAARSEAREVILPPVRPNASLGARYREALEQLIDEMCRSVRRWTLAAYRGAKPEVADLAQDELAADEMQKVMEELKKQWGKRFEEGAAKLAKHFAKKVSARTDASLRKILDDAGFSVKFALSKAQKDAAKAIVHENVSLIKSIPEQLLKNVEGSVMRSVQVGNDVGALAKDLEEHFGVTRRKAKLIARDQNNKATSAFNRIRQLELDIEEAIWQHSHAGKVPRPSHVKAGKDRVRYKVAEGWWDPHEKKFIWPGMLIRCRCSSRSVIKGFV